MGKSAKSRRWVREHAADFYVKQAKDKGYRSRAVFKLIEIDQRDKLFTAGMVVVDLGAAPGGWSDYANHRIGPRGHVTAVDVLSMDPIPGVSLIQGDIHDPAVESRILASLCGSKVDLVIADIAPNITGIASVDQPRVMQLAARVLELAVILLAPGGGCLIKLFHGEEFDSYINELKQHFKKVQICKPKASKTRSREVYVLARCYDVS